MKNLTKIFNTIEKMDFKGKSSGEVVDLLKEALPFLGDEDIQGLAKQIITDGDDSRESTEIPE